MSRILRRPMFRGGRVDSRGTGITSGLSYAKGGSVNIPKRGLVDGPGGYAGMGTGGFYDSILGKGLRSVRDYVGKPFLNFINQDIANPILSLGGYGDAIPRMETPLDDKYLLGLDENYDKIPSDEYVRFSDRYQNKGKGPIETDSGAIPKAIMQNQDKISQEELLKKQLENLNKPKPKEDPVDPIAGIEDNKELFAELLGSKKARGDDISQMLLSFAGKALKPEATVKSSFGEFFEDEAKRPSRKQKIDDNAAALAINQYIAGEKSKADLETILARTKFGVDYTATIKKAIENSKSFPTRLRETAGTTGKTTDKSVITAVLSEEDPPQVYAGDLPKDVESITAGVFYTRDREGGGKELIMFDSAGNVREELTRIIFR